MKRPAEWSQFGKQCHMEWYGSMSDHYHFELDAETKRIIINVDTVYNLKRVTLDVHFYFNLKHVCSEVCFITDKWA